MKVYSAIASVMADLSKIGIGKDKKNQQQGFMYRGVDDVMNALAPIISKHGLVILPRVTKREVIERQSKSGGALFYVTLDMEFDFVAAEDGSKHVVGPVIGEAMDSGDKASNKAMSIAYKYACFQAFCIPTEADPDAEVHEVTHQPPPKIADADREIDFGKHKGTKWRDVDVRYLNWLINECAKPPAGAVKLAQTELERRDRESRPPPDAPYDPELPESAYRGLPQ
jgi:ERF superfamily